GLVLKGKATAVALGRLVDVPGMKRVTGSLAYQAQLTRQKQGYLFALESDTRGLALDFPAPLSKPADQERTLKIQWTDADPKDDALQILYGGDMRVELRHTRAQLNGPYFQQAAIGIGQAASVAPGLQVDIVYPLFDLDVWNRLVDEFSIVRRTKEYKAGKIRRTLWPDLRSFSVQADQLRLLGTRLDQAVLRVVRSSDDAWSMNVRSRQTTGTVKWQELDGRVQGKMSARFAHLSLGDDPRDNNALLPDAQVDEEASFDDDLEIPAIVLQADRFDLYGHSMGALSLEGERDGIRHIWTLKRLSIAHGKTQLQGTGTWRLRGLDRGLSLNAHVQTDDLGAWMDQAGWKNMLVGGAGSLKGDFTWRNLPWTHNKEDLQGALQISLDKGRFPRLGTHTAKLLEFLSLQSIARLTKLDSGLSGLLHEGVPFDQLRGSITLNHGEAQVRDYKLIGSIGTILLDGSTNILNETLNLQAVVVPNLDVSGAAIAAGIAINPLVGLGAFVTQWLLKTPLAKAMTAHYDITGTWDDPKVKDIPLVTSTVPSTVEH
ncbi:MAG TPA: AsmA-like C-terminal region-containing protein, partial [Castellaniella sp.]|uniref:YhdP family phospholipid transporter n=1 Tax=Castellaniella sp. TaxID=1955812 RepID=UPI002F024C56